MLVVCTDDRARLSIPVSQRLTQSRASTPRAWRLQTKEAAEGESGAGRGGPTGSDKTSGLHNINAQGAAASAGGEAAASSPADPV